jgi:hypothetical protein
MISIVISACLMSDPKVCKDYKIQLGEDAQLDKCAEHAPPYFVPWSEEHPGWQIKKWRCTAGNENDI